MSELAHDRSSALSRMGIDFDALYRENFPMMVGLAIERFRISEADAQTLANRVFLLLFLRAEEVRDPRRSFAAPAATRAGNISGHSRAKRRCRRTSVRGRIRSWRTSPTRCRTSSHPRRRSLAAARAASWC